MIPSTWNSERHTTGDAMLGEIKGELGFDSIELGHAVRLSLMPGIQKMFDSGQVRFTVCIIFVRCLSR